MSGQDRDELLEVIARAIASVPAARAPEAVLAAIREQCHLIPRLTADMDPYRDSDLYLSHWTNDGPKFGRKRDP